MFFAAFTSRSCRVPHDGHVQRRVERDRAPSRCPHAEQVLELGYQRSAVITVRPYAVLMKPELIRSHPTG
jgi:hypothetical protein